MLLAVQFACMAKASFQWRRCHCQTQELLSSSLQIRETKFAFQYPKTGIPKLFCLKDTYTFTQHQGLDILCNVIVSEYVTFYQTNKFFVKNVFVIDKTYSCARFGL